MKTLNRRLAAASQFEAQNKQIKFNIIKADTVFVSEGIGVLTYAFQKYVYSARLWAIKVMKR